MATPPIVVRNRYTSAFQFFGMARIGNYLIACNFNNGLNIYRIENDNLVFVANEPATAGTDYQQIHYDGTYIMVAGNNSLNAYTFNENTGAITYLTRTLQDHVHDVKSGGGYYFVSGGPNPGGWRVMAYTFDGANFTQVGFYTAAGITTNVSYINGIIVVTVLANGLISLSFDGANFTLLDSILPGGPGVSAYHKEFDDIVYAGVPVGNLYRYSVAGGPFNLLSTYSPVGGLANFFALYPYLYGVITTLSDIRIGVVDNNDNLDTYYDYPNPAGIIVRDLYCDEFHAYLTGLEVDTFANVLYVMKLATPVLMAAFSFLPESGKAPLKVQFTDTSSQRYI